MINKLKYLLTFIVIGLGIINFSSAGFQYHYIGVASTVSGRSVSVENYGNFLTESAVDKKLLDFGNGTVVFWAENNDGQILPYAYNVDGDLINGGYGDGFFVWSEICDELTITHTGDPTNCGSTSAGNSRVKNTRDYDVIVDFMESVGENDIYGILANGSWHNAYFVISSHEKGKSIKFSTSYSENIENSLNLPVYNTITDIPDSVLKNSPGYSGGGFEPGGGGGGGGGTSWGDLTYNCTNGDIKNYYQSKGFSSGLCYAGLELNGNGSYIYGSGTDYLSVVPVFGWGSSVYDLYGYVGGKTQSISSPFVTTTGNWFRYWRSAYNSNMYYQTGSVFDGYPVALWSYFNLVKAFGYSYTDQEILDYCNILFYTDLSEPYNGYNSEFKCSNGYVYIGDNPSDNGSGSGDYISLSGNVIGLGRNPSLFTGSYTGDNIPVYNIKGILSEFFNKINSIDYSDVDVSGGGILPSYIIAGLFFIIVFRFIRNH